MDPESLFAVALGIASPWEVERIEFSKENKRLDIKIGFSRDATFACPVCGNAVPAYDTKEKTWRHLNFFQYEAYLTARVPRVTCPNAGCKLQFPGREKVPVLPFYSKHW
jgi:transposase